MNPQKGTTMGPMGMLHRECYRCWNLSGTCCSSLERCKAVMSLRVLDNTGFGMSVVANIPKLISSKPLTHTLKRTHANLPGLDLKQKRLVGLARTGRVQNLA